MDNGMNLGEMKPTSLQVSNFGRLGSLPDSRPEREKGALWEN
jgi:hypothetical protein